MVAIERRQLSWQRGERGTQQLFLPLDHLDLGVFSHKVIQRSATTAGTAVG